VQPAFLVLACSVFHCFGLFFWFILLHLFFWLVALTRRSGLSLPALRVGLPSMALWPVADFMFDTDHALTSKSKCRAISDKTTK